MKIRLKHILIICLFFCIVNNPTKATSIDFYSYLTIEVKPNVGAEIYSDNPGDNKSEASLNVQHEITTSAEKIQTEFLRIYPNPSNGIFSIAGVDNKQIEVYNIYGTLIYSSKNNLSQEVNLRQLPKGVYFIKIKTETKLVLKRIVII